MESGNNGDVLMTSVTFIAVRVVIVTYVGGGFQSSHECDDA